MKMKIVKLH